MNAPRVLPIDELFGDVWPDGKKPEVPDKPAPKAAKSLGEPVTWEDLVPFEQQSKEWQDAYLSKKERNKRSRTSFHAARTKAYFEERGYAITRCEVYNAHAGVFMDLFGFADFLAFGLERPDVVAVQQIGRTNLSEHIRKICAAGFIRGWLSQPNRRLVFVWWNQEKKGSLWHPYLTELTLEVVDFKQDPANKGKHLPPFIIGVEL